ncbi:MAG TPA: carboxypeptidase-like regulatory domain-containing protein [Bryobacteraceae bacterium]|nr:carboxypeptidase-like regulatory domain-containing protein [Bryobacteraceae bacterium]
MIRQLFVVGTAVLMLAALGVAQESRGTISGTVTDPQGAVVPGAAVTVTNTGTNVSNKTQTNQAGYFEVTLLNPGSYSVTIEASGFKTLVRSGLDLQTGGRLDLPMHVEVGQAVQSVEVTGQAPLLDVTTAGSGRVLDNRDVTQLPYTAMNPFALQAIAPGMQFTGTISQQRVFDNAGTASYNTDGGVGTGNEFLLDGSPVTGTNGGRAGFVPSAEAVGEIRIEPAPFDASMGHTSGAFITATTKSGTNTYHGSVFDQMQQNRWNATPHFTRLAYNAGIASGSIKSGTPKQASGRLNQPGFSLGGPVRIPKLYNGKDKFFFFFQYDNITQVQPNPNSVLYTVPTPAEKSGDFSALLGVNPVAYTIYDPRSAAVVNGHVTRTPFPGNKGIPILNPAYKFYSPIYPDPNNVAGFVQPDGTNNYYDSSQLAQDRFNSIVNRYDYNLNERYRLTGKWYWNHRHQDNYDWGHTTPLAGIMSNGLVRKNKGGSGDLLVTLNSNNILDIGFSITRYYEGSEKTIQTKYSAADAGLPSYIDAKAGGYDDLPAFNITGVAAPASAGFTQYPSISQIGTTGQVDIKMTSVLKSHTLKYGWDDRRYWYASAGLGYPTGNYTYNNTFMKQADNTTTASNTGLGWAAFMMGLPATISLDTNDTGYYSTRYHSLYIQDDYRVSSRLHFGFGLRFEREGGISERFNRGLSGDFDFGFTPPYAQAVEAAYAAKPLPQLPASQFKVAGGAYYLGTKYDNWTAGTNRFLPNVSAVYQIDQSTVLRAGYGWSADTFNGLNSRPGQNGYSQATTTPVSTDNGLTFCCSVNAASGLSASANPMTDPFPVRSDGTRFTLPYGNSLGSNILDGQGYTFYPHNYTPAIQQRWRIGIQRQITANQVVEVSYNGAYASVPATETLSPLPAQYWATGNTYDAGEQAAMTANVANPFNVANLSSLAQSDPTLYNYLNTISLFKASTVQVQQLLRANPNSAGALKEANAVRAKNTYNDIEALYQRRFSHGFQSSVMYTWARGRQQWQPNEFDPSLAWQVNPDVRPNRFVWTAVWELPFGKGRALLNHGFLQHLVGGWQISWIYQYQSGAPISWSNLFYYGSLDQVVSALNHSDVHSKDIHAWFDPAAVYSNVLNKSDAATGPIPSGFVGFEGRSAFQPGSYQIRQFPQYVDSLRADGIHNWDTKLSRRFVIHERLNLNLGLDMLNTTNHTNFAAPTVTITSTNFGRVTSQSGSSRLIQLNMRIDF